MTALWDLEQLERDLIGLTVEKAAQALAEKGIDAAFQPTGPDVVHDDDSVQRVIQIRPGAPRLFITYGHFRRYPIHGVD
ncbi:hypothetical protein GTO89_10375 [Heliobacterium gestii]|uniref:Uncharacterized protein n=1 Tax=Heliomicrobium gestii TaxID=2699 RepID=A0A845LDJ3_HELGE|nr:hypothetical protein [Heliomicrobium gestii]MBM7867142.1 hypothetical protein [Heliomicrobium gestii]MZP43444.1 hypothetical protein [Heliomicrobium gestii]